MYCFIVSKGKTLDYLSKGQKRNHVQPFYELYLALIRLSMISSKLFQITIKKKTEWL